MIDFDVLLRSAHARHADYASASPFPHTVWDNFLPEEVAEAVSAEFPANTGDAWNHYHHYNEKKLAIKSLAQMGPSTRAVFEALQSDEFRGVVRALSGMDDLISDPDLDGAGLHMIRRGGFLNIHADFQSHTKNRHWSRQLNLLWYLNKDWQEEWNGNLELWNEDMTTRIHSILPAFNRCVIFSTQGKTFHGHPNPLACPEHNARRSLALYYFRDEEDECALTPTNYQPRPQDSGVKRILIAMDRQLVRGYSFLKRYTSLNDGLIDRILKRF
jgi:Rps23 Pro-64 3,4-dihydroxylase Tpa1-like proline 4-hydroxylase